MKKWYEYNWMLVLTTLAIFPLGLYGIYKHAKLKEANKETKSVKEKEIIDRNLIKNIYYKYGHPDMDTPKLCNVELKEGNIHLLSLFKNKPLGLIPGSEIKNVLVEDASTFESRVTLARMALVGIFAFGMKKRSKNELAYLTIEWNKGKFDYSVIFEFTGFRSTNKANSLRNKIIQEIEI